MTFHRSPSPSQQSACRSPKMGRRALQNIVASSPSPTRQHRAGVDDGVLLRALSAGRVGHVAAAARPSDLDVRQRRRRNDIVQVESRRVVTVVKDDSAGDTADDRDRDDRDDRYYDSYRRNGGGSGHRFNRSTSPRSDAGRLDDTLYELQRLLSNGKLPQSFLEKLVSDDDITDRLLTEFEKLTATAPPPPPPLPMSVTAASAETYPPSLTPSSSSCRRSTTIVDRRPPTAPPSTTSLQLQQHRASSSSSTPEMTAGGRRSVRFDGTVASTSADPSTSSRTRRRRRDGRNNNRSRSRSGGRSRPPPPPPMAPPEHVIAGPDFDDDSTAEHGCCSTCSSSSGSELDDLSVYRLPARRSYGPGVGAAARISYVPNDAIAYAKQQAAGHRSPGKRTAAVNAANASQQSQTSSQQSADDKNCTIQ